MGNTSCYSFEKIFTFLLNFQKVESHTIHIKQLYYQIFRVVKNKVLRKIFGVKRDIITREWRKLHNAELHAFYSSPNIIRNLKSRRLRWAGHIACM